MDREAPPSRKVVGGYRAGDRMPGTPAYRLTLIDHRNGHHSGHDRSCLRCWVRAAFCRTPRPVAPSAPHDEETATCVCCGRWLDGERPPYCRDCHVKGCP